MDRQAAYASQPVKTARSETWKGGKSRSAPLPRNGHPSRCFVSVVNTAQWMTITGETPPGRPFTAKEYTDSGLLWFDYYDGDTEEALEGSARLRGMASVAQLGRASGKEPLPENVSAGTGHIVRLGKTKARQVREGAAGDTWA